MSTSSGFFGTRVLVSADAADKGFHDPPWVECSIDTLPPCGIFMYSITFKRYNIETEGTRTMKLWFGGAMWGGGCPMFVNFSSQLKLKLKLNKHVVTTFLVVRSYGVSYIQYVSLCCLYRTGLLRCRSYIIFRHVIVLLDTVRRRAFIWL